MQFSGTTFRLNEIQFSKDNNLAAGDSSPLLNLHRYPNDLGKAGLNHYITFEIFVRENINHDFFSIEELDAAWLDASIDENLGTTSSQISQLLARDPGRGGKIDSQSLKNLAAKFTGKSADKPIAQTVARVAKSTTLKKIKESISLYMPDTLQFSYAQQYNQVSVNAELGKTLGTDNLGIVQAGLAAARNNKAQMSPFAFEVLDNAMKSQHGLALGLMGYAVNPAMEVLFSGTPLREFQFEFLFYPRDPVEAKAVYRIIQAFKFHAAPEITAGTAGRYLLAPSAFDIKFMYNGDENPNIPKIATCFCTSVMTDYAPNGFSTYEIPNESRPTRGGTGTPVATRLTLGFTETTMITKELLRGGLLNRSSFEGAF